MSPMNIFVNCANGDGLMIFADVPEMTTDIAQKFCESCGVEVIESYEVKDEEVQYYCYSPVWVTESNYQRLLDKIAS